MYDNVYPTLTSHAEHLCVCMYVCVYVCMYVHRCASVRVYVSRSFYKHKY